MSALAALLSGVKSSKNSKSQERRRENQPEREREKHHRHRERERDRSKDRKSSSPSHTYHFESSRHRRRSSSPSKSPERPEAPAPVTLDTALLEARDERISLVKAHDKLHGVSRPADYFSSADDDGVAGPPVDPLAHQIPQPSETAPITADAWRNRLHSLISSIKQDSSHYSRASRVLPSGPHASSANVFHWKFDIAEANEKVKTLKKNEEEENRRNPNKSRKNRPSSSALSAAPKNLPSYESLQMEFRQLKKTYETSHQCVAEHRNQLESLMEEIALQNQEFSYLLEKSYPNQWLAIKNPGEFARIRLEAVQEKDLGSLTGTGKKSIENDIEMAGKEILLNYQVKIQEINREKKILQKEIEKLREFHYFSQKDMVSRRKDDEKAGNSTDSLLSSIHDLQWKALEQRKIHEKNMRKIKQNQKEKTDQINEIKKELEQEDIQERENQRILNELQDKKIALQAKLGALKRRQMALAGARRK